MSGADVLSQSEIDQLLSALSTGVVSAEEMKVEEKQKKVKVYDFKRPDKFSKDQIRTLYMLHENFARLLNTYLSTNLRTLVNISVASVEQLAYEEFIRSLSNPSVIGIFNMSPLKGNVIFEINPNIAFSSSLCESDESIILAVPAPTPDTVISNLNISLSSLSENP